MIRYVARTDLLSIYSECTAQRCQRFSKAPLSESEKLALGQASHAQQTISPSSYSTCAFRDMQVNERVEDVARAVRTEPGEDFVFRVS